MADKQSEEHHPIVEILSKADKGVDNTTFANAGFKAVAGTHAFRNYNWLKAAAATNKSGNLRGMVVSSRWRVLFNYSSEVGELLENIGTLASFAANIAEMGNQFEDIWKSKDSPTLKGMLFAAAAGTAAERTLLGVVSSGSHLVYTSLKGYCQMAGLLGGKTQTAASRCIDTLGTADAYVNKGFSVVTDTSNQSKAFWWVVDLKFLPNK